MTTTNIPVFRVLAAAASSLWHDRQCLARAAWLPFVAALSISILRVSMPTGAVGQAIANLLVFLLVGFFALAVHRCVLLGPHATSQWGSDRPLARNSIRFFLWLLAMGIVGESLPLPLALVEEASLQGAEQIPLLVFSSLYLVSWPVIAYGFARISMVLPLTAIDEPGGLSRAWYLTRRNGWRMMAGILLAYFPLAAAIGLATYSSGFSYEAAFRRDDPAWRTTAVLGSIQAFYMLGAAFEAAFLSHSYRALMAEPTIAAPPCDGDARARLNVDGAD